MGNMFKPGDLIQGHYGNAWTRANYGWWVSSTGNSSFQDNTAEWLINLKVEMPKPTAKTNTKMSKSAPIDPATYVYRYTYKEL